MGEFVYLWQDEGDLPRGTIGVYRSKSKAIELARQSVAFELSLYEKDGVTYLRSKDNKRLFYTVEKRRIL